MAALEFLHLTAPFNNPAGSVLVSLYWFVLVTISLSRRFRQVRRYRRMPIPNNLRPNLLQHRFDDTQYYDYVLRPQWLAINATTSKRIKTDGSNLADANTPIFSPPNRLVVGMTGLM